MSIAVTLFLSCKLVMPSANSMVHRSIENALIAAAHATDQKATARISFIAVCGDWALVDAAVCDPDCPEGGYSLLRRTRSRWKQLLLPDIPDCDVSIETPFADPKNTCLAATRKKYPSAPKSLFQAAGRR